MEGKKRERKWRVRKEKEGRKGEEGEKCKGVEERVTRGRKKWNEMKMG